MFKTAFSFNTATKRLYSSAANGGKGKGLVFAATVTAGALVGGYLYSNRNTTSSKPAEPTAASKTIAPALISDKFIPFKLSEIVPVSHNASIFRFKLEEGQAAGLNVASCLLTMVPPQKDGDKPIVRPYTPITSESTTGHLDLLIKKYPTGAMTNHIFNLSVGDDLLMQGPIPKIKYEPNMKKEIGMIAGGTGITPMLQVIHKIIENPEDKTKVNLLFANVTEEDILLRDHLDNIERKHPENLKVHYVLDKPPKGWTGESGYITADMVKKNLPSSALGQDAMIFVCGPPGLVNMISGPKKSITDQGEVTGVLKELGFASNNVFKF